LKRGVGQTLKPGFSEDSFYNKIENDIYGLTFIKDNIDEKIFEEITPLINEAYGLLKDIGLETNINISKSEISDPIYKLSLDQKQNKFKDILESYVNVEYIKKVNDGSLIEENENLVKKYIDLFINKNSEAYKNTIYYAMFEAKIADFIFAYIVPKIIQKEIEKKIEEIPSDYFDTFDNTFDEKYNKIKDISYDIAKKFAPILFKKYIEVKQYNDENDGDISNSDQEVVPAPGSGKIIRIIQIQPTMTN